MRPTFGAGWSPERPPITAEIPEPLIEKDLYGPGLLSEVIIGKYADYLPLDRQKKIFRRRYGVEVPIQSMSRAIAQVADGFDEAYETGEHKLLCAWMLRQIQLLYVIISCREPPRQHQVPDRDPADADQPADRRGHPRRLRKTGNAESVVDVAACRSTTSTTTPPS